MPPKLAARDRKQAGAAFREFGEDIPCHAIMPLCMLLCGLLLHSACCCTYPWPMNTFAHSIYMTHAHVLSLDLIATHRCLSHVGFSGPRCVSQARRPA